MIVQSSSRGSGVASELSGRIDQALATIYQLDQPTPLEVWSSGEANDLFLKREDRSAIHSYKWRGAFNKMSRLVESGCRGPFVATSAGNHAQGVAVSARRLSVSATIFMPLSTPKLKLESVKSHGGENVEIVLAGDSFDESHQAAMQFAKLHGAVAVPPFDDLDVIAGQATVGCEIFQELTKLGKPIRNIFVPVGGGGLASGVAAAMATLSPETNVIGVEVEGQHSMHASMAAGSRKTLANVDRFCDGTAVACPGVETFRICHSLLHRLVTVSNEQVCAAIGKLWETKRVITEPSGSVALAGMLSEDLPASDGVDVVVVSGSNMDFLKLASVVDRSRQARPRRSYFQFEIPEEPGSLIRLLDQLESNLNIVDFQYGFVSDQRARPVLGVELRSERPIAVPQTDFPSVEVKPTTAGYRFIPFRPDLVPDAEFMRIVFSDRAGSLKELMRRTSHIINICYFDFKDSGETEGHALIGLQFQNENSRDALLSVLAELGFSHESVIGQLGNVLS